MASLVVLNGDISDFCCFPWLKKKSVGKKTKTVGSTSKMGTENSKDRQDSNSNIMGELLLKSFLSLVIIYVYSFHFVLCLTRGKYIQ